MKIFIDENIPYLAEALSNCADIFTFIGRKLVNDVLVSENCDTLFVRSTTKVNEELLKNTKIKFIGTATSGFEHIDIDYLRNNDISFVNAAGSNANSVAELIVYSMLHWAKLHNTTLKDKTIGIIGFGNIGKIVSRYSEYFRMKILINDTPLLSKGYIFPDNVEYSGIDDICKYSDILTNHVPLTKEANFPTYRLIDNEKIFSMPDGALLIHTSRGYVIDEKPLLERLKNNSLSAVIDVWEDEPLINRELVSLTLLSTPHVGGYSIEGKLRGSLSMAKAFQKFSGLKPDLTEINRELSQYVPLQKDRYIDENYVYSLLRNKRKFHKDNSELIDTLNLSDNDRAKAFDALRKNYPARRESL